MEHRGELRPPAAPGAAPRAPRVRGSLGVAPEDIRPLRAAASDAGVSLAAILERLQLPASALAADASPALDLADYFRILEQLAFAAHDETCHLSSRPLMPGTTDFVLSNLAGCADLHAAMKLMARSYNLLHGGAYNRVELDGDVLAYKIDDAEFPYSVGPDEDGGAGGLYFTMECVVIFLHGMLSFVTGDRLAGRLRKVYTRRPPGRAASDHLAFWDVPLRYGACDHALIYDASAAALPVAVTGDDAPGTRSVYSHVVGMVEAKQRPGGLEASVERRVREALEQGLRDQRRIARRLGFSVATLRRRLEAEGTSFRELRGAVLDERAKSLLAERRHAAEVAEALGYSDFRSFTRAFKRRNGITPRGYVETLGRERKRR